VIALLFLMLKNGGKQNTVLYLTTLLTYYKSHNYCREYKFLRIHAIYVALTSFTKAPSQALRQLPLLRLGAIMVWMLNAHIFRPGDKSWDRPLIQCCALQRPQGADNEWEELGIAVEEENLEPALEIRGAYFVSDIKFMEAGVYMLPRLGPRELSMKQIKEVFHLEFRKIEAAMMSQGITRKTRIVAKNMVRYPRIPRPQHLVTRDTFPDDPPIPDFGLAAAGVMEPNNDEAQPYPAEDTIDIRVGRIWQELFHNIIAVSPNQKSTTSSSYCTLSAAARSEVQDTLFTSSTLPFTAVQLKEVTVTTWDTVFFDRFFPSHIEQDPIKRISLQNFRTCSFYTQWETLLQDVSHEDKAIVRRKILDKWQGLAWLPYSAADRMWDTRTARGRGFKKLPLGFHGTAPKIAINPRHHDLADFTLSI
jgi:hypothetical protein